MNYDVQLVTLPGGQPLAVVRRRAQLGELSGVVPAACGTVWNALRTQGATGAGRHVAVYLDDEVNLEVGVEMDAPFAEQGELIRSALPKGVAAHAVHLGPYGQLGAAHDAIHAWAAGQGRALSKFRWEIYGHWKSEWDRDPSQIRTDVYCLLA